jgi:monoamine oxidase
LTKDEKIGIVGFIASNNALTWMEKKKEEKNKLLINQFSKLFNHDINKVESLFEKFIEVDWGSEEFIRGSYGSYSTPNNMITSNVLIYLFIDYKYLLKPFDRIHFCGTEHTNQFIGYMVNHFFS